MLGKYIVKMKFNGKKGEKELFLLINSVCSSIIEIVKT